MATKYVKLFDCAHCTLSFHCLDSYQRHRQRHHKKYRHLRKVARLRGQTGVGDEVFLSNGFIDYFGGVPVDTGNKHAKPVKTPDTPDAVNMYLCYECGKNFSRREHLLSHLKRIHNDLGRTQHKCFLCHHCSMAFDTSSALLNHFEDNHVESRCTICSACIGNKSQIISHFVKNHMESMEIEEKVEESVTVAIETAPSADEPQAPKSTDNKSPFVKLSEEQLSKIEEGKDEKTTKQTTAWGVKRFKSWLTDRNTSQEFEKLPALELAALLRQFYAEVRKCNGEEYSKNAICGIRSAIHRHITSAPFYRTFNIIHGGAFKSANNMLVGVLKELKREGRDQKKSYEAICEGDLQKLMSSNVFGTDTPSKLLKLVWFSTQFYLCRRGGEGQQDLRTDSFEICSDSAGRQFVQLRYNEASKNHPGDRNDPKKKMFETGGESCPVAAVKKYLLKVNPSCKTFYQRPIRDTPGTDENPIWYTGEPLGINKLRNMMATISVEAELSKRYTNHCIRFTVITNLINSGFDPVTISRLSGHRNPASVLSYCNDASEATKRSMADALNSSLGRSSMHHQPAPMSSQQPAPTSSQQPWQQQRSRPMPTMSTHQPWQPQQCSKPMSTMSTHQPWQQYQRISIATASSQPSSSTQPHGATAESNTRPST